MTQLSPPLWKGPPLGKQLPGEQALARCRHLASRGAAVPLGEQPKLSGEAQRRLRARPAKCTWLAAGMRLGSEEPEFANL